MDDGQTPIECGHCGLVILPDEEYDADYNFYMHHQRAHRDCPDWPALQTGRMVRLEDGRSLLVGDSPPSRILLQN